MRAEGISHASGDIIAILDPYSLVTDNWLREVIVAHAERDNLIIGGAVNPYFSGSSSLLAWATYINEYGMFMSPIKEGETSILPGSNISYKRECLFNGDIPRYNDFWKTFINWNAEKSNSALWLNPSIVVTLHKPIPFREFFRSRFDHGRCFGGMRIQHSSLLIRIVRITTAPGIPFVLLWRWSTVFWKKGRYRTIFIKTLPIQFALFGYWALGELVGYFAGSGSSCSRLYY